MTLNSLVSYSLSLSSLSSSYKALAFASLVDSIVKFITIFSIEFIINFSSFDSFARFFYFIIAFIEYFVSVTFIFINKDKRKKKKRKRKRKIRNNKRDKREEE